MKNLEIFAIRVKELRKQRRLSQTELGEVLGLTHKSISTIESGVRGTTIEKLILLAKFFEVSTDYLLGLKDEP
ncbi:MAG: helix-turn-helix transcriptional regulator [Oscillospiraceae bacterium]|jgi:transcriptional regulator with XRE-family HTH domain|nr:helix-turn-helix transcriptional regulator [Oscillospiraceae bacterium]MCI9562419.1 helix-turn-helix transcriptional regulator [Oscillospiraceae bacterium]